MYQVELSHASNPDVEGGYWSQQNRPKETKHKVSSFKEASDVCRQYIAEHDLGGGNWTGGQVFQGATQVAMVSYNGRVWDMSGQEIPV